MSWLTFLTPSMTPCRFLENICSAVIFSFNLKILYSWNLCCTFVNVMCDIVHHFTRANGFHSLHRVEFFLHCKYLYEKRYFYTLKAKRFINLVLANPQKFFEQHFIIKEEQIQFEKIFCAIWWNFNYAAFHMSCFYSTYRSEVNQR